jgi:hypothetical protein
MINRKINLRGLTTAVLTGEVVSHKDLFSDRFGNTSSSRLAFARESVVSLHGSVKQTGQDK